MPRLVAVPAHTKVIKVGKVKCVSTVSDYCT
jgi:hypothetical protein